MTITGGMKQQATSYTIDVNIPKAELAPLFDQYWNEVKDILPNHLVQAALKGGFRKVTRQRVVKVSGGKNVFYAPVLTQTVENYLNTQEKQAIAFNSVDMKEDDTTGVVTVSASVFLEPGISWKKKPGIDEPLTIKLAKEPANLIDILVEDDLKRKQAESTILVPLQDDAKVELGHVAVLDGQSAMLKPDGTLEQWTPGCFTMQKWLIVSEDLKQPEIIDSLLGAVKGDVKSITMVLNDKFGADAGKTVEAKFKVQQVLRRDQAEINDDLAKTHGYDTLAILKSSLAIGLKKKVIEVREKTKRMQILNELANPAVVDVDPLPIEWLRMKGQELYREARSYTRTEEELVSKMAGGKLLNGDAVVDRGSIIRWFAEKAAQELIQDLIIRSWGKLKGVEGDATLKNLGVYNEAVSAELLKLAVIEEVEVPNAAV